MKVFISYAHTDEAIARRVADILHEAGLEVWEVTREILPGDNWAAKVDRALREPEAMVVLLTRHTMRSNWVRSEIEYALGEVRFRDRLITVVARDPAELKNEDVPWILWNLKTINLTEHANEEEGIREVARTLQQVA